mmetsp:Transcript_19695/g.24124  ORF Transcript_19695/g.24124 Transcript_19695/m.24124 type:complete len:114 (-) Transcript_19695:180-521(-)
MTLSITANEFKFCSSVILFTTSVVGGALPLCCNNVSPRIRSGLNMFSGGIFFAASILHLLPDAIHIYNEQLTSLSCKHPNVVSTSSLSSSCQDDGTLLPFFFFRSRIFAHVMH